MREVRILLTQSLVPLDEREGRAVVFAQFVLNLFVVRMCL